jgi:uncharacterized protein YecT (DUF1311 family)
MSTNSFAIALAVTGFILLDSTGAAAEVKAPTLEQAKHHFAQTDAELNKVFDAFRKKLGRDGFKDLRDRQRQWLEHRDYISADQPRQNGFEGSNPKSSAFYWEAMADLTEGRTRFLRASYDPALPKGISGVYEDSYGGELKLEETKEGVAFAIEVVRGPTSHTGGLTGMAMLKRDAAFYAEQVEASEDRQPCELTFTFVAGHIVKLEGKNTEFYHGARAYFVGTYFKVAKLDKPIDLKAGQDN